MEQCRDAQPAHQLAGGVRAFLCSSLPAGPIFAICVLVLCIWGGICHEMILHGERGGVSLCHTKPVCH